MFSTAKLDSVNIEPSWKSEKSLKTSETQTNNLNVKDSENQSVTTESAAVQTDKPSDTVVFAPCDEASLAEFLRRVGPAVCRELERAHRSKAFADYGRRRAEDDDDDALEKLFTLHCPSFVEKRLACTSLSWNATGSLIVASYGETEHEDWCEHQGGFCAWNVNQSDLKHDRPRIKYEHSCCVTFLKFHPDQPSLLIGGSFIGEILLWDLNSDDDKLVAVSPVGESGHKESITGIAWVKDVDAKGDNKYLIISCGLDGRILVWKHNSRTNKLEITNGFLVLADNLPRSLGLKSSRMGGEIGVTSISFNVEDPEVFVIGTEGGGIFKCSLNSRQPVHATSAFSVPLHNPVTLCYEPHRGRINTVECSPFSRNIFMTCGSDGELRIYSMHESNKPILQLLENEQFCTAAWSPTRAAMPFAVTASGQLRLYDLRSDRTSSIVSVDVSETSAWLVEMNSKDPKTFATATQDGKIQVWSLAESLLLSSTAETNFMLELGKISADE